MASSDGEEGVREIKFRVWDSLENKWMRNFELSKTGDIVQMGFVTGGKIIEGCILGQFTGLKDRNGKEIYEGDIIQPATMNDGNVDHYRMTDTGAEPIPSIVEWDQDYACFYVPLPSRDFEVIGNIYENPEMLEKMLKGRNP
jgi:uncharacterized phage protein (TIGR01671 family)